MENNETKIVIVTVNGVTQVFTVPRGKGDFVARIPSSVLFAGIPDNHCIRIS